MVLFWVSVLAISILLYVLLDGFDLGVGMLFGLASGAEERSAMMAAVAPVWDGNETWLVVAGVVLWGDFPVVYSTLFSAFYLPVLLMVSGLILRGVAFEYRAHAEGMRWFWDIAFSGGSLVAAFMQGLMVGALVEGLPIAQGEYAGGPFGWLSAFAVLCGIGLCLAYTLLGACWLIRKTDGDIRSRAYARIPTLAVSLAGLLIIVFVFALTEHLQVMDRWLERPYLFAFPVIGVLAAIALGVGVRQRNDSAPGYAATTTFVAAFATLAITFWPYMIPFSITVDQAAAPESSLSFMFWGAGLFVLPLMFVYTLINYHVFRGKTAPKSDHY